ncbi:phytoene/squalene synthase family protein [Arenibaculum sp.]|jgi:phytoene synthase|uniref:phytoene/squalene synthase family protein n=1 Tax=Arenibaculum sp. TaxID=2865862 RepID=UPI002E10E939|nr:phytoene/squalene synthase family protein [Arenibaculum sp.]
MANPDAALSYCGREVRRHDNDRYQTCLFAPADRREGLFALYAFNVEIAKTREVVTEPILGQIRLQWWREAVEELFGGTVRRHEVVQGLAEAVAAHGLSRASIERLIDAREADLDDEPPATLDCLVSYAEVTGAPLAQLALEVLGVRGEAAMAAARHVGIAWALTGLLRAVPFHARSRRLYLPRDLLDRHDVAPGRLFEMKAPEGLREVVRAVAATAADHLREARARRRDVPRAALPALLPATLADVYLSALAKAGHDPYDARFQVADPLRPLRLAGRALIGRY